MTILVDVTISIGLGLALTAFLRLWWAALMEAEAEREAAAEERKRLLWVLAVDLDETHAERARTEAQR